MKNGWTNVEPEALSEPAGAFRSAARKAALLELNFPPGGTVVVVVDVEDDELQAASRAAAARPSAASGRARRARVDRIMFGAVTVVLASRVIVGCRMTRAPPRHAATLGTDRTQAD